MTKKWKHDELLWDLADHLAKPERMLWRDMQLGPSGSPRPDVYTMRKSFKRPDPRAYEIKVSVADFRSDVTAGKWQSYLRFAGGVTFCVPAGLISKADLPATTGLMVRGEEGWRTIKAPTLNPVNLEQEMLIKLLIDGVDRLRNDMRPELCNEYLIAKRLRGKLGSEVAEILEDTIAARHQLEWQAEENAKHRERMRKSDEQRMDEMRARARADCADYRKAICKALDIDLDSADGEIRAAVRKVELSVSESSLVEAARSIVNKMVRDIHWSHDELSALGVDAGVEPPARRRLAR